MENNKMLETFGKMVCALQVSTEAHQKIFDITVSPADSQASINGPLAEYMAATAYAQIQRGYLSQEGGLKFLETGLPQEWRNKEATQKLTSAARQEMQPMLERYITALDGGTQASSWVSRIVASYLSVGIKR